MIDQIMIKEALTSGLEPLTIKKQPVFASNGNPEPIAYRTEMILNSTLLGILTPDDYRMTADKTARGILLSDRLMSDVVKAIEALEKTEPQVKWISVSCPLTMITKTDLVAALGKLFDGDENRRSKLMLEFPAKALYEDPETLKETLMEMKLLKVKSALAGYGNEYCPMMRLASFPFDYVILDPCVRELMRKDQKAAETLISYARSLRIEVVATGIENGEAESPAYYKADCFGFTDNTEKQPLLPEESIKLTPDMLIKYYAEKLKEADAETEENTAPEPSDGSGREEPDQE